MPEQSDKFEPAGRIAFDVEIARHVKDVGGWDYTGEMGVACAVVYEYARDRFRAYDSSELEELRACIDRADTIVSWNGWNFDLPVVYGINRPDWKDHPHRQRPGGKDGKPLAERSCDLLREVYAAQGLSPDGGTPAHAGWRLQDASGGTLGVGKCGEGALAPDLYKQGRWGELFTYCQHDVWLTARLDQFVRRHGFLVNTRNKLVRFARKAGA